MIAFDPNNIKVTFGSADNENFDIVEDWLNNTLIQRLSWLEDEAGDDLELENVEELEIQFTWIEEEDPPKIKVNSSHFRKFAT